MAEGVSAYAIARGEGAGRDVQVVGPAGRRAEDEISSSRRVAARPILATAARGRGNWSRWTSASRVQRDVSSTRVDVRPAAQGAYFHSNIAAAARGAVRLHRRR